MTIRKCAPPDVEILQRVAKESFVETFSHANTPENMRRYLEESFSRERLARELANGRIRYYLLWVGERPAGYLKLNEGDAQTDLQEEDALEIERIYVLQAFQGRGYGGLLLHHGLGVAESMGKKFVWLGVWDQNENAIGFYEHVGFTRAGSHAFFLGGEEQTDLIMKRKISD